jgi:Flp pilus assembly protein TadG
MHPPLRSARWLRRSASEPVADHDGTTARRREGGATRRSRSWLGERGTALMETALTLPLLLLVSVGIFEFGRAYQCWQVLTNAAREGARVAVLPGMTTTDVQARVKQYMTDGQIGFPDGTTISVDPVPVQLGGTNTAGGSKVTIAYPFKFIVLNPVAKLVASDATVGSAFTMTVAAIMRNES